MKVTVFTPTYNRAYTLERLYNSLKEQSFGDFEWILVDDGSTDDTYMLAEKISNDPDRSFDFIYRRVDNGGKHRAVNIGVKLAKGELFYIVDSDDALPKNALERIVFTESTIPDNQKKHFAGVCGVKGGFDGKFVGSTFQTDEYLDITMLQRTKYNITGDKAEVFYTDIMKKYPFPEFDGEKFVTECVVWDKIAYDGYKLRFFNELVYMCEYMPDGLSANYQKILNNSPRGYGLYLYQCKKFGKSSKEQSKRDFLRFYYTLSHKHSIFEIADFLCQNHLAFFTWINLIRVKNKINYLLGRN